MMRFLVTAGPTREYLDQVRFLSNASSGRMGYAVARAAARRGHQVHLIVGPVAVPPLAGVRVVRVTTTGEMYRATAKRFPQADCLVGAAAPADFRPARRAAGKLKKSRSNRTLLLRPTVDILATLGRRKKRSQVIIAFALEGGAGPAARRPLANALEKLRAKNADAVVLNRPQSLGACRFDATVILRGGDRIEMRRMTKERVGRLLVLLAEWLHQERSTGSAGGLAVHAGRRRTHRDHTP